MGVTNISNATNGTVYYCQYGIATDGSAWSYVVVANGSNTTNTCFYCNFTLVTKPSTGELTVDIYKLPWLYYSSLPARLLALLGLAGVAYGVKVIYDKTTT